MDPNSFSSSVNVWSRGDGFTSVKPRKTCSLCPSLSVCADKVTLHTVVSSEQSIQGHIQQWKMSFSIYFWLLYHKSHSNHFTAAISTPKGFELVTIVNNSYNNIAIFTDGIVRAQCLRHEARFSTGLSGYPSWIVTFLQFQLTPFSQILWFQIISRDKRLFQLPTLDE